MINNQETIYNSLKRQIRELTKHGNSDGFRKLLYAYILFDLKDWAMMINPKDNEKLQAILTEFMLKNNEFLISRMPTDTSVYRNVNTPQTIYDWSRVWDIPYYNDISDEDIERQHDVPTHWEIDPSCTPEVIYTYGEPKDVLDISKLTTCEKMNVYIDRITGKAWYLTQDCKWEPVKNAEGSGLTPEEVLEIVKQNRGKINHTWSDTLDLSIEDDGNGHIELAHENELEDIL